MDMGEEDEDEELLAPLIGAQRKRKKTKGKVNRDSRFYRFYGEVLHDHSAKNR